MNSARLQRLEQAAGTIAASTGDVLASFLRICNGKGSVEDLQVYADHIMDKHGLTLEQWFAQDSEKKDLIEKLLAAKLAESAARLQRQADKPTLPIGLKQLP